MPRVGQIGTTLASRGKGKYRVRDDAVLSRGLPTANVCMLVGIACTIMAWAIFALSVMSFSRNERHNCVVSSATVVSTLPDEPVSPSSDEEADVPDDTAPDVPDDTAPDVPDATAPAVPDDTPDEAAPDEASDEPAGAAPETEAPGNATEAPEPPEAEGNETDPSGARQLGTWIRRRRSMNLVQTGPVGEWRCDYTIEAYAGEDLPCDTCPPVTSFPRSKTLGKTSQMTEATAEESCDAMVDSIEPCWKNEETGICCEAREPEFPSSVLAVAVLVTLGALGMAGQVHAQQQMRRRRDAMRSAEGTHGYPKPITKSEFEGLKPLKEWRQNLRVRIADASGFWSARAIEVDEDSVLLRLDVDSTERVVSPDDLRESVYRIHEDGRFDDFRNTLVKGALDATLFKKFDVNNDGALSLDELVAGFKDMDVEVDPSELKSLMKEFDTDNSGTLDLAQWKNFLLSGRLV